MDGLGGADMAQDTPKKSVWWGSLWYTLSFTKALQCCILCVHCGQSWSHTHTQKQTSHLAVSQSLKTPYWSTARVCYWPPQWERRMAGWLPEYALCILRPGRIWINTVHLPHTASSSLSSLITWLDFSFPSVVSITAFLTEAVEGVSDWLRWQQGHTDGSQDTI